MDLTKSSDSLDRRLIHEDTYFGQYNYCPKCKVYSRGDAKDSYYFQKNGGFCKLCASTEEFVTKIGKIKVYEIDPFQVSFFGFFPTTVYKNRLEILEFTDGTAPLEKRFPRPE